VTVEVSLIHDYLENHPHEEQGNKVACSPVFLFSRKQDVGFVGDCMVQRQMNFRGEHSPWFNRFRKILVRYEKLTDNSMALLHMAAAIIACC